MKNHNWIPIASTEYNENWRCSECGIKVESESVPGVGCHSIGDVYMVLLRANVTYGFVLDWHHLADCDMEKIRSIIES